MDISKNGLSLIQRYEGFRSSAYQDMVGVWTIGFGTTEGVKKGDVISLEDATKRLISFLEKNVYTDRNSLGLNQNQFDACCSFCYNLGMNKFHISTLRKKIVAKDWKGAAAEFLKWDMAGGKHVQGLTLRRKDEALLFMKDIYAN
jgi:lysozyme